jgi:Tol biopolymer transport system component
MTTEHRDPHVRRLVFELVDAAPEAPPFPSAVPEDVTARRRLPGPRSLLVAALVVALVVGAVVAVVAVRRSRVDRPPVQKPTITPTDATVAYIDGRGLVVRAPSGDETVLARGAVSRPRWSPSGDWLAYRNGDEVWVARSDGRASFPLGVVGAYEWSPTVDAVAATDDQGARVWLVHDSQADLETINPPVGGVEPSVQSVAWSGGGTSLAIGMWTRDHAGPGRPTASLWLAVGVCRAGPPAECGRPRQLQKIPYTPGLDDYPLLVTGFAFENRLLFWTDYQGSGSVQMDGLPLKAVDRDTGVATDIATTIVRDSWVQPSPDGSQLLVVRSNGRMVTDPREVDLCNSSHACRALAPAHDVQTLDPAWSPDGRRIAFVREDHASFTPPVTNGTIRWTVKYRNRRLWIANADGSDAHEITAAGGGIADPQFAPDGQSIVFVRDARVWQIDLATGHAVGLTGSLGAAAACTFDDCLPNAAPYEATNLWSNYYAVKFAATS